MNWVTQGQIAERSRENLGASDRGLVVYRRMLVREIERIEQGHDPINIIRDPAKNKVINLPLEHKGNMVANGFETTLTTHMSSFSPIAKDLIAVFASAERKPVRDPQPAAE